MFFALILIFLKAWMWGAIAWQINKEENGSFQHYMQSK